MVRTGGRNLTVQKADVKDTRRLITTEWGATCGDGGAEGRGGAPRPWGWRLPGLVFGTPRRGTDMKGFSRPEGAAARPKERGEWAVPTKQGDAPLLLLLARGRGCGRPGAVRLRTRVETTARCCCSLIRWNWKTERGPFSPAPCLPVPLQCLSLAERTKKPTGQGARAL